MMIEIKIIVCVTSVTYYKKDDILYLVTIYSKTEQDTVLTERLRKIVRDDIER